MKLIKQVIEKKRQKLEQLNFHTKIFTYNKKKTFQLTQSYNTVIRPVILYGMEKLQI